MYNALLLAGEMVFYFCAMAALFRMRERFGIGIFVCAFGMMHFLETYLAAVFYVQLPFGAAVSPGSAVLFTGKVMLLLLVYIREDAATVRQPIYGLFIGNALLLAFTFLVRQHELLPGFSGAPPDVDLMNEMGWLMVWGTMLLFVDSVLIILLYEQTAARFGSRAVLRIWVSSAAVLTFDQVGFYLALRTVVGAPGSVLWGGWVAKMAACTLCTVLLGLYLRWCEGPKSAWVVRPRVSDLFDALTYRERYETLLEESGRDSLTGVLNRARLEVDGPGLLDQAFAADASASLLVIDIDHFKAVNDRFGHVAGDRMLRSVAQSLAQAMRDTDRLYRYGGEEFVLLCPNLGPAQGVRLAERLRQQVAGCCMESGEALTVSIGVASCPDDGFDLVSLFAWADARLYDAKAAGRNRVQGSAPAPELPGAAEPYFT